MRRSLLKTIRALSLAALLAGITSLAAPARPAEAGLLSSLLGGASPSSRVAMSLQSDGGLPIVSSLLRSLGWVVDRRTPGPAPLYVARPTGTLSSAVSVVLQTLASLTVVRRAEENFPFFVDRRYGGEGSQAPVLRDDLDGAQMCVQPSLELIGASGAARPAMAASPTVAVADGGFDFSHEAMARVRLVPGFDVRDGDADVTDLGNGVDEDDNGTADDGVGHGTAVVALVSLVAPEARVLPIRVLDDEGVGTIPEVASAVYVAIDRGASVVNLSLGATRSSAILEDALAYAASRGVVVFAAAGNAGTSPVLYPASSGYAAGVISTDTGGVKDPTSNFGAAADLGAPGLDVVIPFPRTGDRYGTWRGTSFATPLCAGAVAYVMSQSASSAPQARNALYSTATAYPYVAPECEGKEGRGLLNVRPWRR